MKTALPTLILLFFISTASSSQTISGVPLKEVDSEYIRISGSWRINKTLAINIDFGQKNEPFNTKDNLLLDDDEKPVEFNSIIDAINFLSKNGYELVDTYVIPSETSGYTYHILKKKNQ